MKIKWFGHSAFNLTTRDGVSITVDPYRSGAFDGAVAYSPIVQRTDLVLISHDHPDHNDPTMLDGRPTRIDTEGCHTVKDIRVTALPVYHDEAAGKERGRNLIFIVEAEGLRTVHLGDLGHLLAGNEIERIGRTDVLMLPVGGTFTITAQQATQVMNAIKPVITLPMHYRTGKMSLPLAPIEEFTRGKTNLRKVDGCEIDVAADRLPKSPEIILLEFAN